MSALRATWLTGLALLGLALLRLDRVFLSSPEETVVPWRAAVVAAAACAFLTTRAVVRGRFRVVAVMAVNGLVLSGFVVLYVGYELSGRIPPRLDLLPEIGSQIGDGVDLLREAVLPVTPQPGVVALATMAMWTLAALAGWGLLNHAPYLAVVPPAVFYLQLAVADRQPAGLPWTAAFLGLTGAGLAAVATTRRTGRTMGREHGLGRLRPLAVPVLATAVITATALVVARQVVAADIVPEGGVIDPATWASSARSGGSISYNPFINVRRALVSNTATPVFEARLAGPAAEEDIYWQLTVLDFFNGRWWYASESPLEQVDDTAWEPPEHRFRGSTLTLIQDVTIRRLSGPMLPAAYSPVGLDSSERRIANTARFDAAGLSLRIDGRTAPGMTYRVESLVPDVELGVLAVGASGTSLSPLFQAAADEGRFPSTVSRAGSTAPPPDLERYVRLPDGVDPTGRLLVLAEAITVGLETDFERALALEHYLRDPARGFSYSVNVPVAERDSYLSDWLTNPTSPGYRTGYCEQFSASMGVLVRLLGIPSRTVLGFTPGDPQADGTVIVRDQNAHAWAEVWLPGQGWIRFDPTPRTDGVNPTTSTATGIDADDLGRYLAAIRQSAQPPDGSAQDDGSSPVTTVPDGRQPAPDGPTSTTGDAASPRRWLAVLAAGAGGAVALGAVPAIKHWRRIRRMRRLQDGEITAAWAEIVDRLVDSDPGVNPADTPVELAVATVEVMQPLAEAYSATVYARSGSAAPGAVQAATHSFFATEQALSERETPLQRLRRTYRIRSLRTTGASKSRSSQR